MKIKKHHHSVPSLLNQWTHGNDAARDALFEKLYEELIKLSTAALRNEKYVSLSSRDLVNEAVIRLISLNKLDWQDKVHFMAMASRMMRRVLIEHLRKKNAGKRINQVVTIITHLGDGKTNSDDALYVERALDRLYSIDEDRAQIVEMRYYGGLSLEEIAEVTGKSVSTVQRSWRISRAWFAKNLQEENN